MESVSNGDRTQSTHIMIQPCHEGNDCHGPPRVSSSEQSEHEVLRINGETEESKPPLDNHDLQTENVTTVTGGTCEDASKQQVQNPPAEGACCQDSNPHPPTTAAASTPLPLSCGNNLTADQPTDGTISSLSVLETLETEVLQRLTLSQAVFKSQQREDPELNCHEKMVIARDLLHNKPTAFLSRFGRHMTEEDLPFLRQLTGDCKYMVEFYIKEIENKCDSKKNSVRVKNRRYEAMKQLESAGEYFDDEQMKSRDPLLYEQMVGQYLDGKDAAEAIDRSDLRLSTILVKHMDILQNNTIYNIQKEYEESQMEESEDEEEEEDMQCEEKEEECPIDISEIEKKMLRAELVKTMQERFIQGQDKDFDYSTVDNNAEYDSLDIREQDEQERYFDDDSDVKYFDED